MYGKPTLILGLVPVDVMLCCCLGFGIFRASWTGAISFLRQSGRVTMTSARFMSVHTTDLLCCGGLELKFKYWSVWVSLRYTDMCTLVDCLRRHLGRTMRHELDVDVGSELDMGLVDHGK